MPGWLRLLLLLLLGAAFCGHVAAELPEDGLVEEEDISPEHDDSFPEQIPTTPSFEYLNARRSEEPYCGPGQQQPLPDLPSKFMLIVSKMDGELIGLDAGNSGKEIWRINTDGDKPLLSSTLSDIELQNNNEIFRLIPSLDGNLYMYQSSGLMQAIPVSGDSLMSASLRFGQDVVAGGRTVATHGINVLTGQLHYSCTLSDCERTTLAPEEIRNNLVVKRTSQTVRALDPATGFEKWNVSVGDVELMLSRGHYGQNDNTFCQGGGDHDYWRRMGDVRFILNPPTGYVAAVSVSDPSRVLWEVTLGVPLAQAWELREWGLGSLSLFDAAVVPSLGAISRATERGSELMVRPDSGEVGLESLVYMGTYNREIYVIPSPQERRKLRVMQLTQASSSAALDHHGHHTQLFQSSDRHELMPREPERIYAPDPARPPAYKFPATPGLEECRFESCPTCSTDQAQALITRQRELNYDGGWYLYKHKAKDISHKTRDWMFSPTIRRTGLKGFKETIRGGLTSLFVDWWRTILLCGVSVLLTMGAMTWKFRRGRLQIEPVSSISENVTSPTKESVTPDVVKESGSFPSDALSPQTSKESAASSASLAAPSRFLEDYQPIKVLGRGGFGVVYEALNKVDQHSYAVKRVAVPTASRGRKAVARVSREVGALASLHHPAIVRYFYAWFESYPLPVQREVEARIKAACCEGTDDDNLEWTEGSESRSFAPLVEPPSNSQGDLSSFCKDLNANLNLNIKQAKWRYLHSKSQQLEASKDAEEDSGLTTHDDDTSSSWAQYSMSRKELSRDEDSSIHSLPPSPAGPSSHSLEVVFQASSLGAEEEPPPPPPVPEAPERLYLYITMQLCQESSLALWLCSHPEPESRACARMLDWFAQILSAVEYVHDYGLIHRDLKPSNIFFDEHEHMKVGDFGLVTQIADELLGSDGADGDGSDERNEKHTSDVGTRLYMSPEQRAGASYTAKVDNFSLGLILFEMLVPFGTEMERRSALCSARQLIFPPAFENTCAAEASMVRRLLSVDPLERPTCAELRVEPALAQFYQNPDWIRNLSAAPSQAALLRRTRTSSSRDNRTSKSSKESSQ